MMVQNFNDPLEVSQKDGVKNEVYFTSRQKNGLYPHQAMSSYTTLARNSIHYNNKAWQNFPIVSWFYDPEEEDMFAYEPVSSSSYYFDD